MTRTAARDQLFAQGVDDLTELNALYESQDPQYCQQICQLGHQSIVNLMRGLLRLLGVRPPKTKDLSLLGETLSMALPGWHADCLELDILTNNALGQVVLGKPATEFEAEESYLICGKVAEELTNRLERLTDLM